ncbi:rhodanese-like domain-containing protein [Ramlibacter albus]|uniref:Rhodanese-like domain-containing protein n=1 Tax=Ramlibacter albus TaxID=2079448 RepID=A0A923S2I2_9BURK|nr:rhodanese-like domain-containing protein [Ramlibacter albus]MBC5765410.1 rhodanese-like domain-containing protein [Ramlibacter albus]
MKFIIDNWALILIAISSGGMLLWPVLRGAGPGSLTAPAAVQLMNRSKAVVVDVSEPEEFAKGHVVGSRNIPFGQLEQKLEGSVKNKALPLILVCSTGARANRAVPVVKKLGYGEVQALSGGLNAWKEANLPLEKA